MAKQTKFCFTWELRDSQAANDSEVVLEMLIMGNLVQQQQQIAADAGDDRHRLGR